jgi:uncharacterized OsmC-like protein
MVHEENTNLSLILEKDMIFKSVFDFKKTSSIIVDESVEEKPQSEKLGPDAATLLGMGIVSCLSASFLFCLKKRDLSLDDLEAHVDISFHKIDKGYTRIKKVKVKLIPKTQDEAVRRRIKTCMREIKRGHMFFEETCIITSSVKEGLDIDVKVEI